MGKHELAETATTTADVAVFVTFAGQPYALLVRRLYPPYAGCWALPGGHIDPGETPTQAAVRELAEETGVHLDASQLVRVGVYDTPDRDPRGHYSTTAYTAQLDHTPPAYGGDDADQAAWVPCNSLQVLAFDHGDILGDAWLTLHPEDS